MIILFSQTNSSLLFCLDHFSCSYTIKQSIIIKVLLAQTSCDSRTGARLLCPADVQLFILLLLGRSKHDRTASNRKSHFTKSLIDSYGKHPPLKYGTDKRKVLTYQKQQNHKECSAAEVLRGYGTADRKVTT